MRIEESLHCQSKGYRDRIEFANAIMKYQVNNLVGQSLHYNAKNRKQRMVLTLFMKLVKMLPWYS